MDKLLTLLTIVGFCNWSYGQSGTVSSGGLVSNGTFSLSYSLGQVFDSESSSNLYRVNEGIQQPFIIGVTDSKDIVSFDGVELKRTGNIIELIAPTEYNYFIVNYDGKLLKSGTSDPISNSIDLTNYIPGLYYLSIMINDTNLKTFKIIIL